MRSRIQLRIDRVYHTAMKTCNLWYGLGRLVAGYALHSQKRAQMSKRAKLREFSPQCFGSPICCPERCCRALTHGSWDGKFDLAGNMSGLRDRRLRPGEGKHG